MELYFLNGLIIGLNVFQLFLLMIYTIRRKRSPFSAHILGLLIIVLCVVDATIRSSVWPLVTLLLQVCILIMLYFADQKWDIVEMHRRDRKIRQDLEDEEWRTSHINRELEKVKEDE